MEPQPQPRPMMTTRTAETWGTLIVILSLLFFFFLIYTLYANYKTFQFIADTNDCSEISPRRAHSLSRYNFWILVVELLPVLFALLGIIFLMFGNKSQSQPYMNMNQTYSRPYTNNTSPSSYPYY